jgi:protein TonB
MEPKKSIKANLENKKNIFLMLGLVVALTIVLIAFEWKSKPSKVDNLGAIQTQLVEDEIIPITREQEIKTPPPPPKVIEVLNIVDNNVNIDEELKIEDSEADDNTLITVVPVISTTKEEEVEEETIFYIVEDMPVFPGGEAALRTFLGNSIKYPVIAQENGIQGKVYVTFVVGKDGVVYNAVIARGVDPSLDKEALRVVNSQPKWKPGMQRGKPVNVSYTVPINFVLQ